MVHSFMLKRAPFVKIMDLTPWPPLLVGEGEILGPFCGLNSPSLLKRRGRGISSLALVKICIVFNNS
jgi:hypothetical protein